MAFVDGLDLSAFHARHEKERRSPACEREGVGVEVPEAAGDASGD